MVQSFRRGVATLAVLAASSLAVAQTSQSTAYDDMGRQIESVAGAHDAAGFARLVDVDAVCKRIFRNINNPMGREMEAGVRSTFGTTMGGLITQLPPDGKVTFLRHRKVGDEERVTMRLISSMGINYWDCVVEPVGPGGALRIADMHMAISGEPFSQTIQRLMLRMVPADGKAMTAAELRQINDMKAYTQAARTGDARAALAQFDALPEKLKKEKTFHILRVMAAARVAEEPALLDAVVDDFKTRFGDDPACDLIQIDTLLSRKQFRQALVCIDRVDESIGGDPYLDVMRSTVSQLAADMPAAKRFAASAHKREPALYLAADRLLTIALEEKDFIEVKRWLQIIEATPAYEMRFAEDLNNAELFAAFKASPQYKEWVAERERAKPRL